MTVSPSISLGDAITICTDAARETIERLERETHALKQENESLLRQLAVAESLIEERAQQP